MEERSLSTLGGLEVLVNNAGMVRLGLAPSAEAAVRDVIGQTPS